MSSENGHTRTGTCTLTPTTQRVQRGHPSRVSSTGLGTSHYGRSAGPAEEERLTTIFRQNSYPLPFICAISSSIHSTGGRTGSKGHQSIINIPQSPKLMKQYKILIPSESSIGDLLTLSYKNTRKYTHTHTHTANNII